MEAERHERRHWTRFAKEVGAKHVHVHCGSDCILICHVKLWPRMCSRSLVVAGWIDRTRNLTRVSLERIVTRTTIDEQSSGNISDAPNVFRFCQHRKIIPTWMLVMRA